MGGEKSTAGPILTQTTPPNPNGRRSRKGAQPVWRMAIAALAAGAFVFLAYSLFVPIPVHGQDGDTNVLRFQQTAGPYDIRVAVVQSALSLGTTLFAITILDAATEEPVPDARVVLRPRHESGDQQGKATAHNTVQSPERYDAQVNLDAPGHWLVTVEVDSSLGLVAVAFIELEVPEARKISGGTFVFYGAFAMIMGGVAYVWWSAKRQRRRNAGNGR